MDHRGRRAQGAWMFFAGAILCLCGIGAAAAQDEADTSTAPRASALTAPRASSLAAPRTSALAAPDAHPGTVIRHKAKAPARRPAGAAENGDDPEARPLTRYQKPGTARGEEDSGSLAMNVAGKLALVVALILGCAAAWKRFQGGMPQVGPGQSQPVKVTSTVPLGPQRFLHLVSVGRHQLLLASSPQSVSLLATLDSQSELVEAQAAHAPRRPPVEEMAEGLSGYEDAAAQSGMPADRFEELLLRLRDLEPGSTNVAAPVEPRTARDQPAARTTRSPIAGAPLSGGPRAVPTAGEPARTSTSGERRAVADDAGDGRGWSAREMAGALAPGSLFRSPARVAREGGDA